MQTIIEGVVQDGSKRGKDLGFPTINLAIDQTALEDGIYISETVLAQKRLQSVTFIGKPITFDDPLWRVETHILDFDTDIYGQSVRVVLLQKIRDNMKFDDTASLVVQMQEDVRKTREYFAIHPFGQES